MLTNFAKLSEDALYNMMFDENTWNTMGDDGCLELLQEVENGKIQVFGGVLAFHQGFCENVVAIDGRFAIGSAQTRDADHRGSFFDLQLRGNFGSGGAF